jgi:hypothetical protein
MMSGTFLHMKARQIEKLALLTFNFTIWLFNQTESSKSFNVESPELI